MPGNLPPTVEVNSPPRLYDHRHEFVDGPLPLRHFTSVDNFVKPPTQSKMPRKPSFIRAKSRQVTVTPEEFNSLPTSIQMKYFSPGERLRIAKEAARQARKKQSISKIRPSIDSAHRPKTGLQSETEGTTDVARRPQSAHARYPSTVSSTVSRPSTEDNAINPGVHFRLCRKGRVSSTGRQSTGSQAIADEEAGKTWLDTDSVSVHSDASSGTVEGIFKLYGNKSQLPVGAVSNILPVRSQYCQTPSPTLASGSPPLPRRRAVKLTPLRLPPPTLLPAIPALPSPTTLQHMTRSIRSNSGTSAYSAPPYWSRDEGHARNPEKFDEAVQFGRTIDGPEGRTVSPLSNTGTYDSAQRASDTDGEPDDDDDDDTDDVSSAITPSAPSIVSNDHDISGLQHPSVDSDFAMPIASKMLASKASIHSLSPDMGSREATVQVVLNRSELNAPEQRLYSYQRKQVSGVDVDHSGALTLQELYVCDDHSGAQGAFAVYPSTKNGGLRKVWKNITRR